MYLCSRRRLSEPVLSTLLTLHVSPMDPPHPPSRRSQRPFRDLPLDILTAMPTQGPVMLSCETVSGPRFTRRRPPLAERLKHFGDVLVGERHVSIDRRTGLLLPTTRFPLNSWNPLKVMKALRPPCAKLWETELTPEAGAALMRRVYSGGLIYCCPHTTTTNEANILQLLRTELAEASETPGATALLLASIVVGFMLAFQTQAPSILATGAMGMTMAAVTFVSFLIVTRFLRKLTMSRFQGATCVLDADISRSSEILILWAISFLLPLSAACVNAAFDKMHAPIQTNI